MWSDRPLTLPKDLGYTESLGWIPFAGWGQKPQLLLSSLYLEPESGAWRRRRCFPLMLASNANQLKLQRNSWLTQVGSPGPLGPAGIQCQGASRLISRRGCLPLNWVHWLARPPFPCPKVGTCPISCPAQSTRKLALSFCKYLLCTYHVPSRPWGESRGQNNKTLGFPPLIPCTPLGIASFAWQSPSLPETQR